MKDEYLEGIMAKVPDETLDHEKPAMTTETQLEQMLDMRSDEYFAALETIERLQHDLRECVELLERGRAAINHVGVVTGADEWTEQCDALLVRLKEKP